VDIAELYDDDGFNNLLVMIASQRRITEFDDYRQDVFLEIVNCGYRHMRGFKQAARRVAQRHRNYYDVDIFAFAADGEFESSDEIMGRLVFHGRGRYV
jgi:hypothetical protein